MTCRRFVPDVIDQARGIVLDPSRLREVTRHLTACASCAAVAERERAISAALRRLVNVQAEPARSDIQLGRLLAVFEQRRSRSRRLTAGVGVSLAASVLIVAGLSVGWDDRARGGGSSTRFAATPAPPAGAGEAFVVLPGASALPRFESGQVIRVEIPSGEGVITADVLIGQDGLARAVRLVP